MPKHFFALLAASAALVAASSGHAQTTAALTGFMGDKALLMIDGGTPRVVAVGSSANGVKILSIDRKQHLAEAEIAGRPVTLRLIGLPSSFGRHGPNADPGAADSGPAQNPGSVTIPMAGDGHFYTDGYINGHATKFMIDTGSSSVVLGEDDAQRLGIPYKEKGTPIQMSTANGAVTGYRITIASIVIGGIEERGVEAVVGSNMPFMLLGNSFLSRLKMQRNSNTMLLEKAN